MDEAGFEIRCAGVTARQLESVRRWQCMDRFYEQVQKIARGLDSKPQDDAAIVHDDLARLIRDSTVRRPMEVWRGIRSSAASFGVHGDGLDDLIGREVQWLGFVAASTSREVAEREFLAPPGLGGPVLVRLSIPEDANAAWIAGLGVREMARQGEVLLDSPVVRYVCVNRRSAIPRLSVEVVM